MDFSGSEDFYDCVSECMEGGFPYSNSREYCYKQCDKKVGGYINRNSDPFDGRKNINNGSSPFIFSAYEKPFYTKPFYKK